MGGKVCQNFLTIVLDFVDNIYFYFQNLYLYFSRKKDYHTMSVISKAAYESALKDSVNDYM